MSPIVSNSPFIFVAIFPSLISPFEDVLEGHIAIVGVELQEEGWIEGIRVPDEAEHSHSHLSQQRPGDIAADVQQVLDADPHTVLT